VSGSGEPRRQPHILPRAEHSLSRAFISPNALKVLYRLQRAGFLAYLVGGAVRDLLLQRKPKDFDVGTNARPQQVRQLFHNARVIGRRFRLVMVKFSGEVVEVATFRRSPEPPEIEDGETVDVLAPAAEADEFGTPEEDAWRRDFTVNGLFYNIGDFTVIDHVGGLEDLQGGIIRTIGDPSVRFAEDPVRMMRAVEYGARLGFQLEPRLAEAVGALHTEIRRAAPARIAYELVESLKGGQALPIFRGLADSGLLAHTVPEALTGTDGPGALLWRLIDCADQKVVRGQRPSEETLLGLLLLPSVIEAVSGEGNAGRSPAEVERSVRERLDGVALRLAFSHYRAHLLRTGFLLMSRLLVPPRSAKMVLRTVKHEAFGIAWDLAHTLGSVDDRYRRTLVPWDQAVAAAQAGLAPEIPATRGKANGQGRRGRRHRRGSRRRPGAGETTHE
jgi:poly(A) polymerase